MKDEIYEIINYGNFLLSKGTLLFGLKIKPQQLDVYNFKLKELKYLNDQLSIKIKEISELEIVTYIDMVLKEAKNPPKISSKLVFAYWTGDIFLSKQTFIKYYIKDINMTLEVKYFKSFMPTTFIMN